MTTFRLFLWTHCTHPIRMCGIGWIWVVTRRRKEKIRSLSCQNDEKFRIYDVFAKINKRNGSCRKYWNKKSEETFVCSLWRKFLGIMMNKDQEHTSMTVDLFIFWSWPNFVRFLSQIYQICRAAKLGSTRVLFDSWWRNGAFSASNISWLVLCLFVFSANTHMLFCWHSNKFDYIRNTK